MQKNKNKYLFFYATVIFSLVLSYECMAMQTPGTQPVPAQPALKPIDQMDEAEAKAALAELLAEQDTKRKELDGLKETLNAAQETSAEIARELKYRKENPDIQVGTIGSLEMSPGVSEATIGKLTAEQRYLEARLENKYGRTGRFVYALDKTVFPVLQQELATGANTLRQKWYQTTMEKQNETLGNLKIEGEKKVRSINNLDIATKLIALEHNRTNQEAGENLSDAQTLGQMLQNQHTLSEITNELPDAPTIKLLQEIKTEQLKKLHTKTFASKATPSASVLCANRLVQEVVTKENKEKEKREQKKQERLNKKLNS